MADEYEIDRELLILWLQSELANLKRTSDRNDMYAAGAAKAYEVTNELLKLGAFAKKEPCPYKEECCSKCEIRKAVP